MNTKDFTYLLQHPDKIVSPMQTKQLEEVLEEFPYFQAARSLYLKGLKNLNSFKYNNALKVTAAYTADREVLFDYITSIDFIRNTSLPLPQTEAHTLLDPDLFKAKDLNSDRTVPETERPTSDELDLGTPLPFTKKERYSFSEWLQLTAFNPVKKSKEPANEKELEDIDFPIEEGSDKKKKFDLIDKFIADNPKIKPQKDVPKITIGNSNKLDKKELMTETLAKVYLEQKKYKSAIQAYKILSLKYPEKSGFFADRIKSVERLKADDA